MVSTFYNSVPLSWVVPGRCGAIGLIVHTGLGLGLEKGIENESGVHGAHRFRLRSAHFHGHGLLILTFGLDSRIHKNIIPRIRSLFIQNLGIHWATCYGFLSLPNLVDDSGFGLVPAALQRAWLFAWVRPELSWHLSALHTWPLVVICTFSAHEWKSKVKYNIIWSQV